MPSNNPNQRPVKPHTIDRREQNRQANAQKKPWKPAELHKFDKGLKQR